MKPTVDRDVESNPRAPGPSLRDWALLGLNSMFVVGGLFLLPRKFDLGIVTVVFFGACALVASSTVIRKRRDRRWRPLRAGIVGGVRITPSRWRVAGLSGAMLGLGATLVWFGGGYPLPFRIVAWLIAGVGAAMSIGVAAGKVPVGYLLFTPQGITVGYRSYASMIAWDDIAAVDGCEFNDNPLLRIWLRPGFELSVRPAEMAELAHRNLASSEAWMGAPVAIMTGSYALDLPPLLKAIERYVADPASRAELDSSRLLPPP